VLVTSPLAIDSGFSDLRTGPASKSWQRGFIESWLWVGQVFGASMGFLVPYLPMKWEDIRKEKKHVKCSLYVVVGLCIAVVSAPAIGGFVAVGLMLKDFGNCVRL
jgi:hypothetical protein